MSRKSLPPFLLDTSAAVALLVTGHTAHGQVTLAVGDRVLGLAGHAWFETFSVLTRLPPPARRPPAEVSEALGRAFPASEFLDADETLDLTARLADLGVSGGSVYDALVGASAAAAGLELLTRDRRATTVYRAVGADFQLIG